jgi:hypothetical protein
MIRRLLTAILSLTLGACQVLPGLGGGAARTPPATIALPTALPTTTPQPTPLPFKPTLTAEPDPGTYQAQGLRAEFASDAGRNPAWTRYTLQVDVEFDPQAETASMDGQARILFINPLHTPLRDLELMLWPNDPQYEAEMTAGPALIDGRFVDPVPLLGHLALSLPLAEPLMPGRQIDVTLPFHIEAGGPIGGSSPKRFGITEGVLIAPTFYPLVPLLVDGAWQVEPAPPGGDTTNSETALYDVTITSPREFGLAVSGTEIEHTDNPDGTQTSHDVTGPMRDVAFALGPFQTRTLKFEDVELRAWFLRQHAGAVDSMLEAARIQVGALTDWAGPYPYPQLDIVDAPGAFLGIEYPGLVFIGDLGGTDLIEPTVHEVAHQWFYGLVGDDQLHEPWLDEAAATYSEVLYYEAAGRSGRATGLLSDFRAWLRSYPHPTLPIGLGVGEYASEGEYSLFVYVKGALFFDALRRELGDDEFKDFLHLYFQTNRYGVAHGADLQEAAEDVCGCGLGSLFDLWVWTGGPIPGLP